VNWPDTTARDEANTVIGEEKEEFVASVNSWPDILDIQHKNVRMYTHNLPLNRIIFSDVDRSKLAFKSACCIQNVFYLGMAVRAK
jgi:hypothetical protein